MTTQARPTLGIIGAGKVGSALARLWYAAGYNIGAVYSPTPAHARHLAERVSAAIALSPRAVVETSDLTLLTVPDDMIAQVVDRLRGRLVGKAVVHTSGAHDAGDLQPLATDGAMVGSLHPAFPFTDKDAANLNGVTFAVEAEESALREWLQGMVSGLGGQVIVIPPGGKATYHLALALASTYTVTLYALSEKLLTDLGADKQVADIALDGLLTGTLNNLRTVGVPKALTGPLTRSDVSTIAAHLAVLHQRGDDRLRTIYRDLARLSYPMLLARGIPTDKIEHLLQQDEADETDDS